MKKTLLVAILLGFSITASGTVFGVGAADCGRMIAHDREDRDGSWRRLYQNWMLGYLSRVNIEYMRDIGKDLSPDAIYFSVLNVCRENPTWGVEIAMRIWIKKELL